MNQGRRTIWASRLTAQGVANVSEYIGGAVRTDRGVIPLVEWFALPYEGEPNCPACLGTRKAVLLSASDPDADSLEEREEA